MVNLDLPFYAVKLGGIPMLTFSYGPVLNLENAQLFLVNLPLNKGKILIPFLLNRIKLIGQLNY